MKTKKSTVVMLILTLFVLICLIALIQPCFTYAEELNDEQTSQSDTKENPNYCYTPPEFDFLIKDLKGEISFEENLIFVSTEQLKLKIPQFNYYKILYPNGELQRYQADAAQDENSPFAFIGIYEENTKYTMYVHYGYKADDILYNIIVDLTENFVTYFDDLSTTIQLGNNELSDRLISSNNVITKGVYREDLAMPLSLNPISENYYDYLTKDDNIIHTYVNLFLGKNLTPDKKYITDDPIVNIIPKKLCFVFGEHLYIGKEYGFFIKVMTGYGGCKYVADILVFDFEHIAPDFPSNVTGSCAVKPLFQYRYQCYEKVFGVNWSSYNPSLDKIVFLHRDYNSAEYYLDNVRFKISLENPFALNPGDAGYEAKKDDGAFIIQTRYNERGVGLKSKDKSFLKDTVTFAFGFVDKFHISDFLNLFAYASDIYCGFFDGGYFYKRVESVSDNELNIDTFETNNVDQINVRGQLIKSITAYSKPSDDKPRIINVGGYSQVKYLVARMSGSQNNNLTVISSMKVNVLEDNTSRYWLFGWHEKGEIINYGEATGTYITRDDSDGDDW